MPSFSIVARSASIAEPVLAFSTKAATCRIGGGGHGGERMLGRDGDEGHAHDRVGAGGEDVQAAVADQLAVGVARSSWGKAKRTPSERPIQLLCISADPLRPAVELVDLVEQFLRRSR